MDKLQAAFEYLGICHISLPTHGLNEKTNEFLFIDFFFTINKLKGESEIMSLQQDHK